MKTLAILLFLPWTFLTAASPFLGVSTQSLPSWNRDADLLHEGVGLLVHTLVPDSVAASILKPGDILEKLNEQWLVSPEQLSVLVRMKRPGDEVELTYYREGSRKTSKLKLGTRPAELTASSRRSSGQFPGSAMPGIAPHIMQGMPPHMQQQFLQMEQQMQALQQQMHQQIPQMNSLQQSNTSRQMSWIDGETRVEYHEQNGTAEVVITKKGKEQFRGPLNSEEDFQKVPEEFQEFLREKGVEPESEGLKL